MKRIILTGIFLFIFCSSLALNAQWARTYGGSDFDRAYLVQKTSDGGYIAAGYTASAGAGISDLWILKLSLAGVIEWQYTYGGSGDDVAYAVQETSDEGYIIAGYTYSFGAGESDYWILKLTSTGVIEWQFTYGGIGDDTAYSIQETSDEGYIVAGYTDSFGAGGSDSLVLKLSSAGNIEWQRAYGGSEEDVAHFIQETSDGGYITAGYTDSFGAGGSDFLLLKLFSDGDIDPSCELVGISNATVQDTSAFYAYTNVQPQLTSFDPQDTNISPQETYATSNLLCEARPTISGAVKTEEGEGVEGVTITFSDEEGTTTTNSEGSYSHLVSYGWSGTATPSKTGYIFSPSSRSYTNVTSDQADQDYIGSILTYVISGTISLASSSEPLSGVVMDGLPGDPTTDASGYYEATVDCSWSDTVTPTKLRYVFSPSSRSYTDVNSDQTGQDYTAYPGWIISGSVKTEEGEGIGGVTITFSEVEGTATTDSEGSYSYTVIEGWSGTAAPSKTCYSFLPSNRSYSNLTSDQPNQDYTGTLIQHTLIINAGPGGTTQPSQGSHNYDCGTQVEISASPDSGYKFSDWSGNVPSGHESDNPLTITMDSDKSITANFEKEPFWERLCFIATAAYDSPLHPHVKILRDFRDTYLMSSKLGRKLVDLYYKYSPFAAGLITKHKALRIAVRINLLPLVAFSYSMLHFCRVVTAVAGVFIFVFPIFLIWFYRRKARIYRKRNRKAK